MPLTIPQQSPPSSSEMPAFDPDRASEVQQRHRLVAEYLELNGYDGLLLQRPENIAWLTCGAEVYRPGSCEVVAAVFLNREARVLLCSNADSQQLFDGPFSGLGFQLKERPWHEDRCDLMADLCRGRRVAGDRPGEALKCVDQDLADFRSKLGQPEQDLLTELGRDVSHAVEATARNCERGSPESEIAGQIAHRMIHRQITPVRIQVIADGRGQRYRHWGYSDAPTRRFAVLSALGRRSGLHIGVTRTFVFEEPPADLVSAHHHACLLMATGMYFSQPGWTGDEVWTRVQRIYEKFGAPEEWRLSEQANVLGYSCRERSIGPNRKERLSALQSIFWHPTVRQAGVGDTISVRSSGFSILTVAKNWPMLTVQVKGTEIELPAILKREPDSEWAID